MVARVIEGVWEKVSAEHALALKGHRVEIRVLDEDPPLRAAEAKASWAAFEAEIAPITRGKRVPDDQHCLRSCDAGLVAG